VKFVLLIFASHPDIGIDSPARKFIYPVAFITHIRSFTHQRSLAWVVEFGLTSRSNASVAISRARVRKARDFAHRFISVYSDVAASSSYFATAFALCPLARSHRRVHSGGVARVIAFNLAIVQHRHAISFLRNELAPNPSILAKRHAPRACICI